MPGEMHSYCRLCEGLCGVQIQSEGGALDLRGDGVNPTNAGHACDAGRASLIDAVSETRITRPLKRTASGLEPVDWSTAIEEIGGRLGKIRRASGARGIGIYAGAGLSRDHLSAVRAASFALGFGTPNLFTPLAGAGASMIYACEQVLGYPTALQADVGRTHYTILMGGVDPAEHRWGPLQHGTVHTEAQAYFRKSRKTRLVAVDPRTTSDTEGATQHIRIRPGTELYYLLGLCHLFLNRGWNDAQYLRDYTTGAERLERWLAPWTPERVASICGIQPADLSGVGLKFSQAAMATITHGPFLFRTRDATATAWAWLAAHALTANLLRPGGAFEGKGLLDLQPITASLPTAQAPRGAASGLPALLLQLPHTTLAQEIEAGGPEALICLGGDPLEDLPQPGRVRRALDGLGLVVALSTSPSAILERADYVLPATHFWERSDAQLLNHAVMPTRFAQATEPVLPPLGESRHEADVLAEIFRAASPPLLSGGVWGRHLQLLGRFGSTADLSGLVDQALDLADLPSLSALAQMPSGLDRGELDRAQWRVSHPGRRLDLAPAVLSDAILGLRPPERDPTRPLRLIATDPPRGGGEGGLRVSPDAGVPDGAEVRLETPFGTWSGVARLDAGLHPEAALLQWGAGVGELFSGDDRDPFTGAPDLVGVPCKVVAV